MFQKKLCVAMVVVFCLCMAGCAVGNFMKDKSFTNSIGMKFVYIPNGTFMMGSQKNEPERNKNETLHKVTLTKGFYMQTTEVTQEQWKAIMGDNPSKFSDCGDKCPVETVAWIRIQEFIEKLNQKERTDRYRLPTETEWEYAARAESNTDYYFGDDANKLREYAWYLDNSEKKIHPVGELKPNVWGLYDMYGNVDEWCYDIYAEDSYSKHNSTDPVYIGSGIIKGNFSVIGKHNSNYSGSGFYRVVRGGNWLELAKDCRSASRYGYSPMTGSNFVGFRLVSSE